MDIDTVNIAAKIKYLFDITKQNIFFLQNLNIFFIQTHIFYIYLNILIKNNQYGYNERFCS